MKLKNPKIELKNIEFSERMSEETSAFVADLYLDGKKLLYVKNDGHGGSTFYHLHNGDDVDTMRELEAYCETLPPINYDKFDIPMDLEHYIDELFNKWLLKKDMSKGICIKLKNGCYSTISWKNHTLAELVKTPQGKMTVQIQVNKLKREKKEILNTNLVELGINL